MKKFNVLVLALLALTLGFTTSCDDGVGDDFAAPKVTFTQGDQTVDPATSVVITGTVLAPAGLDEIAFWKDDVSYETITKFDTDTTHSFSVTIPADQVEETFPFEVVAKDENGKSGKATATITVTTEPEHEVKTLSSIAMEFNNSTASSSNCAFSLAEETALNGFSGDGSKFDIVFIWNSAMGHTYGSPDSEQVEYIMEINGNSYAGSSRHTKFMEISSADYTGADVDYINGLTVSDNLTLSNLGGSGIQDASSGSTYAFETNDGTVGLVKITYSKAAASSTIEVKYVTSATAK